VKALAAAGVILAVAGGATACGGQQAAPTGPQPVSQDTNNRDYAEKHILLSDGRVVVCLEWMSGASSSSVRGGISCDWDHAEGKK
jgi:hypothetical protein